MFMWWGERLFEGDGIIIKRSKWQFFMIVGIATTMAIKMTKIPWRVFDCSSKLPLSPSSDVGDFEHPDALLLRLRVDKVTSRPSLLLYLSRGKFTNCDLFKPSQMESAQFVNLPISNCIYSIYSIHEKISAYWQAKNTWINTAHCRKLKLSAKLWID